MVAVFTGLGAGFERGSVAALGGVGLLGSGIQGRSGEHVSLNAATGNLLINQQDEFLVGRGLDVGISRTYNSLGALDENGDHWRQSTDRRVFDYISGNSVKRVSADGSEISYTHETRNGVTAYWATDGAGSHDKLAYSGGVWTLTDGDSQVKERYAAHGSDNWRITEQEDLDGNKLTFAYSGNNLTDITTSNGDKIHYQWSGSNITVVQTVFTDLGTSASKTETLTRYTYDSSNRLTSVTTDLTPGDNSISDGNTYVTTYTYDGTSKRIASITQTDGSQLDLTYFTTGAHLGKIKTIKQIIASGDERITTLSYGHNATNNYDYTYVDDPSGHRTTLYYNYNNGTTNQLERIRMDPAQSGGAYQNVYFYYDADGNVTRTTDAAGDQTNYQFDANGNITRVTDPNGNIVDRTYYSDNMLKLETRHGSDANGADTVLYTRYVYDGDNHLRYLIRPNGSVTEYRYQTTGAHTYTIDYPDHTYTVGAASTVPNESQMNVWRNGLADRSSTHISRNIYDARANLARTINYSGTNTGGSAISGDGYTDHRYVYDQRGQLLSRRTIGVETETFAYDGMGRLISSTDVDGGSTAITFNDAATTTTVTSSNGYTVVSTYNKAGELINLSDIPTNAGYLAEGDSHYQYDQNGRLRIREDNIGYNSYFLYDQLGRKIADINHYGHITEYKYGEKGQLLATARYTRGVLGGGDTLTALNDPNNTLEITDVRPAGHGYDIWEWNVYDANGNIIETIDGIGSVTTYEYDASNRLVKTLNYYNRLSSAQITSLKTTSPTVSILPSSHGNDQIFRTFYDKNGQLIGSLNGQGGFTQIFYDNAGQKIQEINYANRALSSLWLTGSFNALLGSVTLNANEDISTHHVYDGQGFLRFSIDGLNHVTEFIYKGSSNSTAYGVVRRTISYAAPLGNLGDYKYTTVKTAVGNLGSAGDNRSTWAVYNTKLQMVYAIDSEGAVTRFQYNTQGDITKTTRFAVKRTTTGLPTESTMNSWAGSNSTDARITRNYYNARDELKYIIDGEGYVTLNNYDKEGRLSYVYKYSDKVTANDSWTISTVGAANKGSEVHTRYTYDKAGRLSSVYDTNGTRHYTGYFATGTVKWEIAAFGQGADEARTLYIYDAAGNKVRDLHYVSDYATGERTDTFYYYNGLGQLRYVRDTDGTQTSIMSDRYTYYYYDKAGNVIQKTDAGTHKTYFEYDAFGNVVKTWDSVQLDHGSTPVTRSSFNYYDQAGRLTTSVDAEGYITKTTYTTFGEVDTVTRYYNQFTGAPNVNTEPSVSAHALDAVTHYEYDDLGRVTKIIDAEGGYEDYTLNAYGQREQVRNQLGGVTYNTFDRRGFLIAENLPSASYNSSGNLVSSTATNAFQYDARGNLVARVEADGLVEERVTNYTYDAGDRLIQTERIMGTGNVIQSLTYDRRGNSVATTDALGNVSYNYYDRLDRITTSVNAEGYITKTTYTAFGAIDSVTQYYTKFTSTLDVNTEPSATTHVLDATTSFQYDNMDRVTQIIDAEGGYDLYTLNSAGHRLAVRNKLGGMTYNTFNKRGELISENLPIISHDHFGAVVATSATNTFEYDAHGNVITKVEAANLAEARSTFYTYDHLNQLLSTERSVSVAISATAASSVILVSEDIIYDDRGNVIETQDANGARTLFYYDDIGRLTHQISATGTLTRHFYDAIGNVLETRKYASSVTLPNDALGTPPSGSAQYRSAKFTYDKLNRLLTSSVQNVQTAEYGSSFVVSTTTQDLVTSFEYDAVGRVVRIIDTNGNDTYSYYDKVGNKTHQIDVEGYLTRWQYDANGNVTQDRRFAERPTGTISTLSFGAIQYNWPEGSAANIFSDPYHDRITDFKYNKNGQRIEELRQNIAVFNGTIGFKISDAKITYLYNALGQVTRKTHSTNDQINYTYDTAGRMIKETRTGFTDVDNHQVTPEVTYHYNALNDLMRVKQKGTTGTTSHRYTTYTYGVGGRLSMMTDAQGFVHNYHYDAAGQILREDYERTTPAGTKLEGVGYEYDLEGRIIKQGIVMKPGSSWTRGGSENDTVMMQYNAFGEISARGINNKYNETFAYDNAGRVWRSTAGDGTYKYFMYDRNGNQTLSVVSVGMNIDNQSMSQILGLWNNTADIATTNVGGIAATITKYDDRNQAIQVLEPRRQTSAGVMASITTSRTYTAFGDVASETNALGGTIDYTYNTMGRLIQVESSLVSVTNASGITSNIRPTEHMYYDVSGRLVASRDANGNLVTNTLLAGTGYDGSQALISQVTYAADGSTVTTEFDIHGDVRQVTDQIGRVTTQTLDKTGRVTQINHAGGLTDNYTYDGLGQRITHWNNLSGSGDAEQTTYDQQGRTITQRAFGGDTTTYAYAWDSTHATTGMGVFGGWTQTTTYANTKTIIQDTDKFGHLLIKTDMGGHVTNYTYDKGGRMVTQSIDHTVGGNTHTDTTHYVYLNTNKLSEIWSLEGVENTGSWAGDWARRSAKYTYDVVGNLKTETIREWGEKYGVTEYTSNGYGALIPSAYGPISYSNYLTNSSANYDALSRLTSWSEGASYGSNRASNNTGPQATADIYNPGASITYSYDANGNIRRSNANFGTLNAQGRNGGADIQDYWYAYDAHNRVTVSQGQLVGNFVVRGTTGTDIFYDAAGQRKYTLSNTALTNVRLEQYIYDNAGHLTEVQIESGIAPTYSTNNTNSTRSSFTYDLAGRMLHQIDYGTNSSTVMFDRTVTYNAKSQITHDLTLTRRNNIVHKADTTYAYGTSGTSGYHLGSANSVNTSYYENNVFKTSSYTNNAYYLFDSVQLDTSTIGTDITTYYYNSHKQLDSLFIDDGRNRRVTYTRDGQGQILSRHERESSAPAGQVGNDPHEVWHRFGGKEMGYVGNNGTLDTDYETSIASRTHDVGTGAYQFGDATYTAHEDFDQFYDPINSYSQGSSGGGYTARAGDTLTGIAANLWGDSSLWYKIAEVNGLPAGARLSEGQNLILPVGITRNTNNASTFKPYDPSAAIGDNSPTDPARAVPHAQPKDNNCGTMGQILLVVVAVAVTVVSAGAALAAITPGLSIGTGITTVLGGGLVGAAGVPGAIAIGAASGAVGSIASQGVGVATGIQDKFSWKAVGLAAIGGGVGAGLGNTFSGLGKVGGAIVRGATSSTISQGIGVATGLQDSFSWAGVAAAGVGAGVGSFAGGHISGHLGSQFAEGLASSAASALANAATRSAIDGSNFGDNVMAAIPDVIGQALGNAVAGGIGGMSTGPLLASASASPVNQTSGSTTDEGLGFFGALSKISNAIFGGFASGYNKAVNLALEGQAAAVQTDVDNLAYIRRASDEMLRDEIIVSATINRNRIAQWDAYASASRTFHRQQGAINQAATNARRQAATDTVRNSSVAWEAGIAAQNAPTGPFANLDPANGYVDMGELRPGGFTAEQRAGLEMISYIPIVGIPASVFLAADDFQNGNHVAGTMNALGAIPAFKLVGAGGKIGMKITGKVTDALSPLANKAANVVKTGWDKVASRLARNGCFVAGTLIHTQDGLRPIEEIQIGDMVWSHSEWNEGDSTYRKVNDTFQLGEKEIWELEATTPSGTTETFRATGNHPFWVEEDEDGWVAVELLEVGNTLRLANGTVAHVTKVANTGEMEDVFNFEVDGFHTYHVGEIGAWVHNINCEKVRQVLKNSGKSIFREGDHAHHILPQKGVGNIVDKLRVKWGRRLLQKNGIDPDYGLDNLIYAQNGSRVHTKVAQRALMRDLFSVRNEGQAALVKVLDYHGQLARNKGPWG